MFSGDGAVLEGCEPSCDAGLLEEVDPKGKALRFYSLALLPVHSLLPACGCSVASCPILLTLHLPCHKGLCPTTVRHTLYTLPHSKWLFARCVTTAMTAIKITSTDAHELISDVEVHGQQSEETELLSPVVFCLQPSMLTPCKDCIFVSFGCNVCSVPAPYPSLRGSKRKF